MRKNAATSITMGNAITNSSPSWAAAKATRTIDIELDQLRIDARRDGRGVLGPAGVLEQQLSSDLDAGAIDLDHARVAPDVVAQRKVQGLGLTRIDHRRRRDRHHVLRARACRCLIDE